VPGGARDGAAAGGRAQPQLMDAGDGRATSKRYELIVGNRTEPVSARFSSPGTWRVAIA
jgi:hypothetical protein